MERALKRLGEGSAALVELPYLLVDIPEGGVVKLLGMFLNEFGVRFVQLYLVM